jgi:hypothetical protein
MSLRPREAMASMLGVGIWPEPWNDTSLKLQPPHKSCQVGAWQCSDGFENAYVHEALKLLHNFETVKLQVKVRV